MLTWFLGKYFSVSLPTGKKTCQNIRHCCKKDLILSFYYVLDTSEEEVKYLVCSLPCYTN